jgi:hypothetical protein
MEIYKEMEITSFLNLIDVKKRNQELGEFFGKNESLTIFNSNIIRAAIAFGQEDLLLRILEYLPTLDLNCFCFQAPNYRMGRKHLLDELLDKGFHKTIELFFKRLEFEQAFKKVPLQFEKIHSELGGYLSKRKGKVMNEGKLKEIIKNRTLLMSLPLSSYHLSVFDVALDALYNLNPEALLLEGVQNAKRSLLGGLTSLLLMMSNSDINRVFLNMTFGSVNENHLGTVFFAKIFRGDDREVYEIFRYQF